MLLTLHIWYTGHYLFCQCMYVLFSWRIVDYNAFNKVYLKLKYVLKGRSSQKSHGIVNGPMERKKYG